MARASGAAAGGEGSVALGHLQTAPLRLGLSRPSERQAVLSWERAPLPMPPRGPDPVEAPGSWACPAAARVLPSTTRSERPQGAGEAAPCLPDPELGQEDRLATRKTGRRGAAQPHRSSCSLGLPGPAGAPPLGPGGQQGASWLGVCQKQGVLGNRERAQHLLHRVPQAGQARPWSRAKPPRRRPRQPLAPRCLRGPCPGHILREAFLGSPHPLWLLWNCPCSVFREDLGREGRMWGGRQEPWGLSP